MCPFPSVSKVVLVERKIGWKHKRDKKIDKIGNKLQESSHKIMCIRIEQIKMSELYRSDFKSE